MGEEQSGSEVGDAVACKVAMSMYSSMDPFGFGHLLEFVHNLCGSDVAGFAEAAKEAVSNIDPKDALCPTFAYLAATPAWRRVRPQYEARLREQSAKVEQARAAARPRMKSRD